VLSLILILLPADDAGREGPDDVEAEVALPAEPADPLPFLADLTAEDFIGVFVLLVVGQVVCKSIH
jgi:hypothetical protein